MKPIYKIVFTFSLVIVLTSIVSMLVFGVPFGVDFKGGSLMGIKFDGDTPELSIIREELAKNGFQEAGVTLSGDSVLIRLPEIDETTHRDLIDKMSTLGSFQEERFDAVGPIIGNELKRKTTWAIVLVFLGIVMYIAFVFRKLSSVLSPWVMGLAAIAALAHDVLVPLGVFAVLGHLLGIELSAVFVAAMLTILGYSVADSVVLFDRVRENIIRFGSKESFADTVHKSVMQTLTRSVNTSFTTLLPLIAIFFFGGETLRFFALFLIMGIFLGAYSSLFVASPILVRLSRKR
jgi:preprotein translocase subunit SecF